MGNPLENWLSSSDDPENNRPVRLEINATLSDLAQISTLRANILRENLTSPSEGLIEDEKRQEILKNPKLALITLHVLQQLIPEEQVLEYMKATTQIKIEPSNIEAAADLPANTIVLSNDLDSLLKNLGIGEARTLYSTQAKNPDNYCRTLATLHIAGSDSSQPEEVQIVLSWYVQAQQVQVSPDLYQKFAQRAVYLERIKLDVDNFNYLKLFAPAPLSINSFSEGVDIAQKEFPVQYTETATLPFTIDQMEDIARWVANDTWRVIQEDPELRTLTLEEVTNRKEKLMDISPYIRKYFEEMDGITHKDDAQFSLGISPDQITYFPRSKDDTLIAIAIHHSLLRDLHRLEFIDNRKVSGREPMIVLIEFEKDGKTQNIAVPLADLNFIPQEFQVMATHALADIIGPNGFKIKAIKDASHLKK